LDEKALRMPIDRTSKWLLIACAAWFGSCEQHLTAPNSGGQPGLMLDFGGAQESNCSVPEAGAKTGDGGATSACAAAAEVDYVAQVEPILAGCYGETCHDFSRRSSVEALVGAPADECCNQRALVAPGHPEQSYLIDKLEGKRLCYGARMPLGRSPLPAADIATLAAWICQGASVP
jgi:hypothetical protein